MVADICRPVEEARSQNMVFEPWRSNDDSDEKSGFCRVTNAITATITVFLSVLTAAAAVATTAPTDASVAIFHES